MLADDPSLTPAEILVRLQANALPRSSDECPRPCGAGLLDADLWSDKLRLAPSGLKLDKGESRSVSARVVAAGVPVAGAAVAFASSDSTVASVTPPSAVTDANGQATATVEGLEKGNAEITAQAQGRTARSPVKVPTVSIWGLLITAVIAAIRLRHA